MPKVLFIMALPFLLWWAIANWWRVRTARSAAERNLLYRSSMAAFIGVVLGIVAVVVIPGQGKIIVLPLVIIGSLIYSRATRAALAKIREREND